MIEMRIPEHILDCVVFLGRVFTDAGIVKDHWGGTGFFVSLKHGGGYYVYLVTARHNIKFDGKDYHARVNKKDGKAEAVPCDGKWYYHPDQAVDVAVLPWSPSHDIFNWTSIPVNTFVGGESWQDPTYDARSVGLGDEVFACGLFTRKRGESKNVPIIRVGNIAALPDKEEPVRTKNGDTPAYLIESRSLGGISGSPVFLPIQHFLSTPMGTSLVAKQFFLLGLIHGHWSLDEQEDLVIDSDRELEEDATKRDQEKINTGIAVAISAQHIVETVNLPELIEMREKNERKKKESEFPIEDSAAESAPFTKQDFEQALKKASRRLPQQPSESDQENA